MNFIPTGEMKTIIDKLEERFPNRFEVELHENKMVFIDMRSDFEGPDPGTVFGSEHVAEFHRLLDAFCRGVVTTVK